MESNKEESLRCIEIAMKKFDEGNFEAACKFLRKSDQLYANDRAKDLLRQYLQKSEGASSSSTTTTSTTTTKTTTTTSTISPEDSKPKYTVEQVEAIRKIKASKNFYEILEVQKTSTDVEIKKQYRKIALQLHPDKNHAPGAEEAFKMVTQAFSCLSDSKKRQNYDLHGAEDNTPSRSPFQRGGGFYYDENLSPEDVFEAFFGFPFGEGRHPGGNIRRRGGNGFQFYSSGFSPYGAEFSFGGPRYARRAAGGAANNGGEESSSLYNLFLIFIPLLLIFFSMISGGGVTHEQKESLFSLNPDSKLGYTTERAIKVDSYNIKIDYYVKENFDAQMKNFRIRISDLEDVVVDKWLVQKRKDCLQKNGQEKLLKKYKGDPQKEEEILNDLKSKKYEYCDALKRYFRF